jgi:hypothetical protein
VRGEAYTGFWWGNLRERLRRRWKDNIKMDLQEVGCWGIDCVEMTEDRDRTCECGNELSGSIQCEEFLD